MSAVELVAFVCCDLGAIVRGRSLAADELGTLAHAVEPKVSLTTASASRMKAR